MSPKAGTRSRPGGPCTARPGHRDRCEDCLAEGCREARHAWYGYNAVTHAWVKATTKAKAFKKAKAFSRTTDSKGRWTANLVRLKQGTLVLKVRATDHVHNRSATPMRLATLTQP